MIFYRLVTSKLSVSKYALAGCIINKITFLRRKSMRNQINFNDIFKSSFWRRCRVFRCWMLLLLWIGVCIGLFIYFVYKKTYKESCIQNLQHFTDSSHNDNHLMILAVTSNVVLSLGMVGALSIVRFRSAIKDPMDIAYLSGQ